MKTRQPPLGPNPNVVVGNTNTTATVMTGSDGNLYEDIDNQDQAGQGQSQTNIQSLTVPNLSNEVLAALKPNTMYGGMETPQNNLTGTSCNNQTGQGQSQVVSESNTNTTATVVTSGDDQAGQGQSQANTASNTNTTATVMASGDDQAGQGQSQANTESNTNTTATVMVSGNDQTGQGQSQAVTESLDVRNLSYGTGQTASRQNSVYEAVTQSQTITNTAVVMTSGDDQTGQGQSQAITESLNARNLSYGTGPTASKLNSVYKTATVMTSGQDQTEQCQSQALTESNTNTTGTVMTSDHYYQYEDIVNNLLRTGQGQSQIH
ncbi:Bax inhibitor 1 [Branchiostoma belcheri]|nr:Bax inhibitor 1 [Branchiostoma belcheri]